MANVKSLKPGGRNPDVITKAIEAANKVPHVCSTCNAAVKLVPTRTERGARASAWVHVELPDKPCPVYPKVKVQPKMASIPCAHHPERRAVVIFTMLEMEVEEPTQALCEECAPPMAIVVFEGLTGMPLGAIIQEAIEAEQAAEANVEPTPAPPKEPKTTKAKRTSNNGHSPDESLASTGDDDENTSAATTEAAAASIDS